MLDLESRLRRFLASAPQRIYPIETLEISHPAMPRTYRLWKEPYSGQITTEVGAVPVEPIGFAITLAGSEGHLDQVFSITIDTVDIADEFRLAIDSVPLDSAQPIAVVYREYLSDDLTAAQAMARLQVESVSYQIGAATISAVSPRLNFLRTGEVYAPRDVPMLRGFL